MISFVWPSFVPFVPWAGGAETYTLGHLKELQRRGISARIVGYDANVNASFSLWENIPFLGLPSPDELSQLDDTLIHAILPKAAPGKHQGFVILHCSIQGALHDHSSFFTNGEMGSLNPIATSAYMSRYWQEQLDTLEAPEIVYPFVTDEFTHVSRPFNKCKRRRVLFAGRLSPDKGIYTLLASLHMPALRAEEFELTCVITVNHLTGGNIIRDLLEAHPLIETVAACKDRKSMAELFAKHDIVVMPTSAILCKEAFGMISAEAQHAGCRVVATNHGGLPETDCGGLILVAPDDPLSLAEGIAHAIHLGPLTTHEREKASKRFTLEQSVDKLLNVINYRPDGIADAGTGTHCACLPHVDRTLEQEDRSTEIHRIVSDCIGR